MTQGSRIRRIFTDLRERKVFRSALAYAVAAWLIVQVADVVLPAFDAPPWMLRAVITVMVLGLPLAIFLAWLYDVTPEGVVRRPAREGHHPWSPLWRLGAALVAVIVTGGTLFWLWSGYVGVERPTLTRMAPPPQPVVAAPTFTNLAGDPALDWLGDGLATLLRDGLAESRHLIVVSPSRWHSIVRGGSDDPLTRAADAGIDYVVAGEILKTPSGLVLTARLTDLAQGIEMQAQRFTGASPQELLGSVEELVMLVKRGLKVPHTEQVDWFAADFAVDNMAAYEAYLGGLAYFLDFAYTEAEQAFHAALTLAPDYHIARYRLGQVLAATGRTEAASAMLDAIPADARLSERERAYVEGAEALFARDPERAIGIFNAVLEAYPYDVEARLLLAQAFDLAYDDAAALAELERLAQQEPENERIWSFIGETNLRLGAFDEARAALGRYLELAPQDPFGFTVLGQIALLTGALDTAIGHLEHALTLKPGFPRARHALGQTLALRGERQRADEVLSALLGDAAAPPADRIDAAFDLSYLRRASGRFASAIEPLTALEALIVEEQIREAMALAARARIEIELERLEAAATLIETAIARSPGVPTRYLFARGLLELARRTPATVRETAREIRSHALPPDDPDRTEEKAAAYLDGMAALLEGEPRAAIDHLRAAVNGSGYRYAVYELGLAQALLDAGALDEALRVARIAAEVRDRTEVRLDLELDRTRSVLLAARIEAARGEHAASARLAQRFLSRWSEAPAQSEELITARRLAATARGPSS